MRTRVTSWLIGIAVAMAAAVATTAIAGEAQYVGASKCKACHMTEYKAWAESAHARALDVLKPEERANPACTRCHVTGAGKPAAAGADLNGVQCEACHGAGSLYKAANVMAKAAYQTDRNAAHAKSLSLGLAAPDEAGCTSCHNAKSPTFKGFDFAAAKAKIKHWK